MLAFEGSIVMHWLLVNLVLLVPALPYLLLVPDYQRRLREKRLRILKLLQNTDALTFYHAAFGGKRDQPEEHDNNAEQVVNALFNSVYHPFSFFLAVALDVIVICLFVAVLVFNVPASLQHLSNLISNARPALAAAFAGSYIWVAAGLVSSYATDDLSPGLLHGFWVRMLAAPVVALSLLPLISGTETLTGPKIAATAFLIAVFPVDSLQNLVRNLARKNLPGLISDSPAQGPTLQNLQGMTERTINRLADEGIDSTERLAYYDPLKLMVRTNIPWVVITDFIDQALLFSYIKEGITKTASMGIRGSIEVAVIGQDLFGGNGQEKQKAAEETLTALASALGCSRESARNLVHTLSDDQQVQFIWSLFSVVTPDDDPDGKADGGGDDPEHSHLPKPHGVW
jgi:hypothetical protein